MKPKNPLRFRVQGLLKQTLKNTSGEPFISTVESCLGILMLLRFYQGFYLETLNHEKM